MAPDDTSAGDRLTDSVSVVVCARNSAATIAATLHSIVRNRPLEIIVIDDQSLDETAAVARRFTECVIRSQGRGLAAARQFGAEQTRGRYVAFVDSDVVLSDGCLAALVTVLEEDAAVACASAATRASGPRSRWARASQEMGGLRESHGPVWTEAPRMGMRACVIRRELLLAFGFDPFFVGAAEDLDLSERLRAAGWRLYRTAAEAEHRHGLTLWGLFRQRLWYGRGSERLMFKRAALRTRGDESRQDRTVPSGRSLFWRVLRQGRVDLAMFVVVSGSGFRLGRVLERIALRNTRYPGATS